jgi:virginiamycin B lyase
MSVMVWRRLVMVVVVSVLSGCGQAAEPTARPTTRTPDHAGSGTLVTTATAPEEPLTRPELLETAPPAADPGATTTALVAGTAPSATSPMTPLADPQATPPRRPGGQPAMQEYPVPAGSHPHDVAPAPDGTVWYTAQARGAVGRLDPATGESHLIPLGSGSAPHGVIVGPDGAAWITDSGLNALVRVDPEDETVEHLALPPAGRGANLNTATVDGRGRLWFTGQNGFYGWLDLATREVLVFQAPGGRGPYGIATTPGGEVYYASLAGDHIARIDLESDTATVLEPPTPNQGARRVWSDSRGRIWVSEWDAGQVAVYDPASANWQEWRLPGPTPKPYAVYVDEQDLVWLSDFGANALVRFDPQTETFDSFPLPSAGANVRQILGRPGEVWGAASGTDALVVIRTR